jgi:hypothetical protein
MGKMDENWLWHKRIVHMKFDNLVKNNTKQVVKDIPKTTKPSNTFCKQCQHGKKSRVSFKTKEYATSKPLELMHTYLCGTTSKKSLQEEIYFVLLIDDYIRMT